MNQVTFKTLDTQSVHDKLVDVASRLSVLKDLVDKVWNDAETSHILPILRDCSTDLAEVYLDIEARYPIKAEAPASKAMESEVKA